MSKKLFQQFVREHSGGRIPSVLSHSFGASIYKLLLPFLSALLVVLLNLTGALDPAEAWVRDSLLRGRSEISCNHTAVVAVDEGSLSEAVAARRADSGRAATLVALAPPAALAGLEGVRGANGYRLVTQPVRVGPEAAPEGALDFTVDPVGSLRATRERLLQRIFA